MPKMTPRRFLSPKPKPGLKIRVLLKGGPGNGQHMPLNGSGSMVVTWDGHKGHYEVNMYHKTATWIED